MNIELKAAPGMEDLLPVTATAGVATLSLEDGATLAVAIESLKIPASRKFMSALNDEVIPGAVRKTCALQDGDTVELLPPLTGG